MIDVTCAVIRNDEKHVLIVQRGEKTDHPFKWEFPGGKVTIGESEEDCIIREIQEEISIDIVICGRMQTFEYDYGHKQIRLIPFICDTLDEIPLLTEHIDYKWIALDAIMSADFSEADVIVAREYLEFINGTRLPPGKNEKEENLPIEESELQSMIYRMMGTKEAEWTARSAIENPAIFNKLIEYSFSADKKLAFKASWTLTKVCDEVPSMIYPYLKMIISELDKIDNDSVRRSFLRIIAFTDIEKIESAQHGLLADHCFRALNSGFTPIAIKAYSMEIIYNLAVIYPELANELSASLNMLQDEAAGIKARGHIILKKLAKNLNPEQE